MAVATRPSPRTGRNTHRWVLVAILMFAFVLRTWNLDWDRGTHLQPDERFWSDVAAHVERPDDWRWGEVLDPELSPLNPRVHKPNYVYGTLPLWASEAAAAVLMTDVMAPVVVAFDALGIDLVTDEPAEAPIGERLRFNTGYDVTIVGRLMSALVDTATVAAVYLLARELADRGTGLLAALLQAATVLHIQYSHFLGSEPWVACFVTIVVWGSVRLARGRGGFRTRVVTAAALGCAVGAKLSGIAVAAAPVVAAAVVCGPYLGALARGSFRRHQLGGLARSLEPWVLMGLGSVVAYRVVQPYDFEAGVSLIYNDRFQADLDYLRDINGGGNWPWVQPLVGATPLWHPLKQVLLWGMGPGLGLAAAAGIGLAVLRFVRGQRFWAVPLSVIGAYFVLVSLQFYAIIRYLQPAYPIMTALAGVALVSGLRWARVSMPAAPRLARTVQVAAMVAVAVTMLWALAFVNGVYGRDNARLAAGDWMLENLAPTAVVSQQAWDDGIPWGRHSEFGRVTLEPFSFGGDTPEHIDRLIAGLDHVDYVIETSNKFYDSLPRTPARFPQMTEYYRRLFDGSLGFERIATFSNPPTLFGITIDDSGAEEAFTLYDHPTVHIWQKTDRFDIDRAARLLNPDRARTALNAIPRDARTNAGMLVPDDYAIQQQGSSWTDVHWADPSSPVAVVWWFIAIQVAAAAVAGWLVPHAGRVAASAWGFSKLLGLVTFALPIWLTVSWGWFTLSAPLVWATMIALAAIGIFGWKRNLGRLATLWARHRRLIVATELVFVVAFLAVVGLRAANPDLWHPWRGGEKPMELAYLTAITGSTTLPPYDPWLAGGSLNYYYWGWFMLSMPTRLLGLAPDLAFNLGVATFAAVAAVSVFSTTTMLAGLSRAPKGGARPVGAGLLATTMFIIVGNLDALRQVISRLRAGLPLGEFDWWDPSRVIKNSQGYEVTEFPFFTVLFADLHPHFMAMGFFGMSIAGAAAFIDATRRSKRVTSWVLAVGFGVVTGLVRMVHTWDLPTVVAIGVGALVFGWVVAAGPVTWRVRTALGQLAAATLAHLFVTGPYRAHNLVTETGFHRSESVSTLDDFIAHWGLFLFVAAVWVTHQARSQRWHRVVRPSAQGVAALVSVVGAVVLLVTGGSVAAVAWLFFAACGLAVWFDLAGAARGGGGATGSLVASACFALGFAVLVFVELFTQNADIARLNTVFKFWLQVWHLFAVASGFAAVTVLSAMARAGAHTQTARRVLAGALVALLAAGAVYPLLSIAPRSANRFDTTVGPSLRGDLWLEPGRSQVGIRDPLGNDHVIDPGGDAALIDWLRANVEGRPTIVEGVGGSEYQWWGRISINTGLPAVLGWRWHQSQQRTLFAYEVDQRKADIAAFYTGETMVEMDAFLRAYDVTYVIVGSAEAAIMPIFTRDLLAANPSLHEVFRDQDRVIYEVAKRSLAHARGPIASIGSG